VLRLIAAVDKSLGVADDHGIPWQGKIPTDARYFRERTTEGLIIMGYATYQEFDKPVHDRENYVVVRTDTDALQPGFAGVPDVANFLDEREDELVWVIGGAALFASTLARADELYLTQVDRDFQCTKFFPDFSDTFVRTWHDAPIVENGIAFHFTIWQRTNNRQN
jgi:dihydrofolate reductase